MRRRECGALASARPAELALRQSLVVADQNDGHSRYRLLETVRQYAQEKLAERGGADVVRDRHRDYFLALAEEAEPKLKGAEQAEWLQRLEAEHDNLRTALSSSLMEAESGRGLRFCRALQRFWTMHEHLSEGRKWCARAVERAGEEKRTEDVANALNAAGALAYHQTDCLAARIFHEKSLAIRRHLGDRKGIAGSLNNLGAVVSHPRSRDRQRSQHDGRPLPGAGTPTSAGRPATPATRSAATTWPRTRRS